MCIDSKVIRLSVRPEFRGRRALLVDVSAGGISFLAAEPLEAGTVLVLDLQRYGNNAATGRIARVRHATRHAAPANAPWTPQTPTMLRLVRWLFDVDSRAQLGDSWLVGCQFDQELNDEEMKELLELVLAPADAPK